MHDTYEFYKIRSGYYAYRGYTIECMDSRCGAPPDDSRFGSWLVRFGRVKEDYFPTLKSARNSIDRALCCDVPISNHMPFLYDDGGRVEGGFGGKTGDCVVRAIAIVTGKPYSIIFGRIALGNMKQRRSRRRERKPITGRFSVSNGVFVHRKWFKDYMKELGFTWTPLVIIGSGCTTHLCPQELPKDGRYVLSLSKHYTALVDGEIRDIYDPSRNGTRCVYGYWKYR